MYANGDGVAVDYVRACKWFNLAAAQGHTMAVDALEMFHPLMSRGQIATADRLSRKFTPKIEHLPQ